jgi:hypothetical protein
MAAPLDFATLASASHLSKADRAAYLKAMQREANKAAARPAPPSKRWDGR